MSSKGGVPASVDGQVDLGLDDFLRPLTKQHLTRPRVSPALHQQVGLDVFSEALASVRSRELSERRSLASPH